MHVDAAGLRDKRTFVPFDSQLEALQFLRSVLLDERGVALLSGRSGSGKSVLANRLVQEMQARLSVAIVDGSRLKARDFLTAILEQFGYNITLGSTEELLSLLQVFLVQQTRTHEAPVLIVENIAEMYPSSLAALAELAICTAGNRYVLRLILTSNRDVTRIIEAPTMMSIADRLIDSYSLSPMNSKDALRYLYAKLQAGGVQRPDDILPGNVCDKLHQLSGGWPRDLDKIAFAIIEQACTYPVRVEEIIDPNEASVDDVPKIIVTHRSETLQEVRLTEKRALIGRADISDIVISDQFVSNQHALLIRDQNAVVLVDLKSRNGTFVNSRRIQSKVLLHNDIVSLGDHRMKMIYAPGHSSIVIDDPELADTAKMKSIADARRARQRSFPTLVPIKKKTE